MDINCWKWAVDFNLETINRAINETRYDNLDYLADCVKRSVSDAKKLAFHKRADLTKTAELITRQPWGVFVKGLNVLCPDGKRRTVRLATCADTFFSIPASLTFRGKSVSGFVSSFDRVDEKLDYQFTPTGKHRDIFEV